MTKEEIIEVLKQALSEFEDTQINDGISTICDLLESIESDGIKC